MKNGSLIPSQRCLIDGKDIDDYTFILKYQTTDVLVAADVGGGGARSGFTKSVIIENITRFLVVKYNFINFLILTEMKKL
jgi:hypothetical protein